MVDDSDRRGRSRGPVLERHPRREGYHQNYRREKRGYGRGRYHQDRRASEVRPFHVDQDGKPMDAQSYLGPYAYNWFRRWRKGPKRWLEYDTRIKCIGWSMTLMLRYGETNGEAFPDIRPDGSVDIEEMLSYKSISLYNTTMEDIEEVLESSVEKPDADGTLKYRFEAIRDSGGIVTAIRVCQGHGKYV